jgi:hypothetical protein
MVCVTDDRWTCPKCGETAVVSANPADRRVALTAIRDAHQCPPTRRAVVVRGKLRPRRRPR